MTECVFCKIVKGGIPCFKIWENDQFIAFLDIKPSTKGMTLVIPKEHLESYVFKIPSDKINGLFEASRTVAGMLEKAFNINRVALVSEGMGVNHLHFKLYPLHGINSTDFTPIESKEQIYFENYQGYLTTQLGPQADFKKLGEIAEYIKKANQ